MATNLAINDELIKEALLLGRQKTKKAVVNDALYRIYPAYQNRSKF
ncbi:MAG: type II toxin-antitoxin system VapB family antitoxin [Desulfobacterales bacterium]